MLYYVHRDDFVLYDQYEFYEQTMHILLFQCMIKNIE